MPRKTTTLEDVIENKDVDTMAGEELVDPTAGLDSTVAENPVGAKNPEPIAAEEPAPVAAEEPAPIAAEEPAPVAADKTTPVRAMIIRGRMPVALVWMIRFEESKKATKDIADQFGTTVGKVTDILKISNFSYIKEDFRPTRDQKDQAIAWLKRHPFYDAKNVDALVDRVDKMPEATAEEAALYESTRKKAGGQLPVTKAGELADAGGGNNIKGGAKANAKAAEQNVKTKEVSGEELLA